MSLEFESLVEKIAQAMWSSDSKAAALTGVVTGAKSFADAPLRMQEHYRRLARVAILESASE